MAINCAVVSGRLTKDPELRFTPTGVPVCTFTLASDRNFKNANGEREADFLPVVVYRTLAELSANVLAKGKKTTVQGRIQTRSYETQDGQRRWVTEIVADIVEFPPKESGGYNQGNDQDQYYNDPGQDHYWNNSGQFNDDDMPF